MDSFVEFLLVQDESRTFRPLFDRHPQRLFLHRELVTVTLTIVLLLEVLEPIGGQDAELGPLAGV